MAEIPSSPKAKKDSKPLFVNSDSEESDSEGGMLQEQTEADDDDSQDVEAMAGAEQSATSNAAPKTKKSAVESTMTAEDKQTLLRYRDMLFQNGFLKRPTQTFGSKDGLSGTGSEHNHSQDDGSDHAAAASDGEDEAVTRPKKRSRHPSKKSSKATVHTDKNATSKVTKPKRSYKKRAHGANYTSKSLLSGDLLGDAARAQEAPSMPVHQGGKRRDIALEGMLASLPEAVRNKKQSKADLKWLNSACKVFGPQQVKPANGGLWKVNGMKSALKPHQIMGTAFMLGREAGDEEPRGGILADQMGLGKTIMTLALIVSNPARVRSEQGGTTLIVVTAGLLDQWFNEIGEHCEVKKGNHRGVGNYKIYRAAQVARERDPLDSLKSFDILLTTYEEVARSFPLAEPPPEMTDKDERDEWWDNHYEEGKGLLHQMHFHRIVLDEAHMIRNPGGKKARACAALTATHHWCLTGTPCVNGVFDLWSLLSFIQYPLEYGYDSFKATFCTHADDESEAALTDMLARSMIRRTHADQLFDARIVTLPDLGSLTFVVNLNPVERAVYEIIETSYRQRVNTMAKDGTIMTNSGSVWSMLIRLRQLTAHPLILQDTMLDLLEREDYEKLNELAKTPLALGTYSKKLLKQLKAALARATGVDYDQDDVPTYSAPGTGDAQGGSQTLNERLHKHLTNLKRKCQMNNIADILNCVRCHKLASDAYVTSCMHIYCPRCLNDAQTDATYGGSNGAACDSCGSSFGHAEPCSDTVSAFKAPAPNTAPGLGLNGQASQKRKRTQLNVLADDDEELQGWLDTDGKILPSAKSIALKTQIEKWLAQEPDTKIIVYTQWLPMIKIMSQICREESWGFCQYTGTMSTKARSECIAEFKANATLKVMLASLKCGGLGLNLTMANKVICVDPWWNNAVEQQAFARVYRIGQTKETSLLSDREGYYRHTHASN
ncbi:hypothetical protein MBLNU457_1317t1 [Dothideomycetes sp. NU457]